MTSFNMVGWTIGQTIICKFVFHGACWGLELERQQMWKFTKNCPAKKQNSSILESIWDCDPVLGFCVQDTNLDVEGFYLFDEKHQYAWMEQ